MAGVSPTHGEGRDVYHNNNRCTERNNIERANLRQGTGGNRLCETCKRLNREGK